MQAEQYGRTNGDRKVLTLKKGNGVSKQTPKEPTLPKKRKSDIGEALETVITANLRNKKAYIHTVKGVGFGCKILLIAKYQILVELDDGKHRVVNKANVLYIDPVENLEIRN